MDIEISRPADIFRSEPKKKTPGSAIAPRVEFPPIDQMLEEEYEELYLMVKKVVGKKVRPGTKYKLKEDVAIIRMARNSYSARTIAKTLGRSYGSVSTRIRWLRETEINSLDDLKLWHRKRGTE